MYTLSHSYTFTHTHTYTLSHTHMYTLTHTHSTHTHSLTGTHTHTGILSHTCAHTLSHTHILHLLRLLSWKMTPAEFTTVRVGPTLARCLHMPHCLHPLPPTWDSLEKDNKSLRTNTQSQFLRRPTLQTKKLFLVERPIFLFYIFNSRRV